MSKLTRFLFGAYTLCVPAERVRDVFNVLITNNIPFGKTGEKEGGFSFCLSPKGYRRYRKICGEKFLFGESARETGAFAILCRYRLRFGMFAGILLFALSVFLSSLFVWDINVSGNVSITEAEIFERLDAYGFRLGTFIPGADTDEICERIILEAGNISFMKINMRGTVASVEIHERKADAAAEEDRSPSNLVAKYDGQIERFEVSGGVPAVEYLQPVKKGELLVSGAIDSNALGYRLVQARGKVFARVTLTFESVVPFENTKKTYTGKEISQKSIKFFSKSLNLSKNTIIPYEKYDTIVDEEKLYLFGIIELPIYRVTVTYKEYEQAPHRLTRDQAYTRAQKALSEQTENALAEAEILSRKTVFSENETGLKLYTEVYWIIDIAEEVKISAN